MVCRFEKAVPAIVKVALVQVHKIDLKAFYSLPLVTTPPRQIYSLFPGKEAPNRRGHLELSYC